MNKTMLLIALLLSPGILEAQNPLSDWDFTRMVDPITDEVSQTISTRDHRAGATISVACIQGEGHFVYFIGGIMGGDRSGRVEVHPRVDDLPALDRQLWVLASNRSATTPTSRASDLLSQMFSGESLLVRIRDPLDGEMRLHSFSLKGFSYVANRLSCIEHPG